MTEKQIAQQAKNQLYNRLIQQINSTFTPSGNKEGIRFNTQVLTRFSKSQLTRIAIKGPKHLYVQNYGFEGVKKNGINMSIKATNVVNDAIEKSGVVNYLANAISESRADDIIVNMKG